MTVSGMAGFEQALKEFLSSVPNWLEAVAARLTEQERHVLQAMPCSPWWVRAVWPTARDLQWRAVHVWFEGERRALHRAAQQARHIAATVLPVSAAYEQVRHLLQDVRLRVPGLADTVLRLQQQHARTLTLIACEGRAASLEAKAAVRDAGGRIGAFIAEQARQLSAWARQRAADLRTLRRQVDQEAARLGLA
ncbi:hypothetical protein [Geochorda subterranea]|uniref:Uncharacterized protein n=1 Tax=Geochorda subterranea TaxID=3109564 RepID=A0ABZ1BSL2_9FIRM|nr:hypothetical protein [Limnochorda sp. LNt]WRP15774.1 hypothetical protein VLY81_06365 [Limnochorda sp. LNt]